MKPTEEQVRIIKDFADTRVMKINAVAGSGKTSTLKMMADEYKKESLYMAFNKAIAQEASAEFPDHVECRTTHSLAFAEFGRDIAHKLKRPKTKSYKNFAQSSSEIASYYNLEDIEDVTKATLGMLVKTTVKRYEQSADKIIQEKHVPHSILRDLEKTREDMDKGHIVSVVLSTAKKYWKDKKSPVSDVLATHDTYLKLWQLSNPRLDYDIIYVDEAQDTNPVVLDVVKKQTHAKIAYVGDTYQSIYQFRGAVNAMETITAPTRLLSMSFRYGQQIADVATDIIGGAIEVKGNPDILSEVNTAKTHKKYTKLFRTNGALISEAIHLISSGAKIKCEIDVWNFINTLESAVALHKGDMEKVKHEDILAYTDWNDLVECSEENPEMKRIRRIIENGDAYNYLKHLKDFTKQDRKRYDIILTTAHKSKGRQWDHVILADDFPEIIEGDFSEISDQERNLIYVAATRAVKTLDVPDGML
jgi:superfamily I DNA/RNA helicase